MRAEAILSCAIEVCPFGVVVVDSRGTVALANRAIEQMFGYDRDELLGQAVEILVPSLLRAHHSRHHDHFASQRQIRMATNRTVLGQRKDGSEIQVEVGLNSFQTGDGAMVLGVAVDVSERTRMESLKSEFVANVSHELRTPLTSVSGALALLMRDAAETLPSETMRLLTIAHANSQRLVRLVNGILDMERIAADKVVFALQAVEIQSLVTQSIEGNQEFARAHGVRLRLDCASTTDEIRSDPNWLDQIVRNLITNAIKFSPPGGEVVIAIGSGGGKVRVSVRDHGDGIPASFKSRVFERFARADVTDARREGGFGLGLSMVKQIVTQLGGEVGFDDAPGGGTIFHFELPQNAQAIEVPPQLTVHH